MANTDQSITEWAINNLAGTYANIAEASAKLREAAQKCHLIGGAAITPQIDGHDIQVIVIPINKAECYPIRPAKPKDGEPPAPPRKGIPKSTLMTIAGAADVEWTKTVRTDDGSVPRYCVFHVEGRYKTVSGTYRPIAGDRDVDLRDGSDEIKGKPDGEIDTLRANMVRSAITKAKLRALRDAFGVSQGMNESELDKPFVFAKAIFTGRSDDPQTRQLYAQVIAYQQLAGTAALYGGQMPQLTMPPIGAPAPRQLQTRQIVDMTEDGEIVEPAPRAAPPPPPPPAKPRGNGSGNGGRPAVWPWDAKKDGDPKKGTLLRDCPTDALERLAAYSEKKAGEGGQWAERDAALAKTAREIIAERSKTLAPALQNQAPAGKSEPVGDGYDDRGDDPNRY